MAEESFDDMFGVAPSPSPAPAAEAYTPPPVPASPTPSSPAVSHIVHSESPSATKSASPLVDSQKSAFQQQWEADQLKKIEEQRKREDQKRKENIALAQKQIKQFYAERDEKKRVALENLKANEQPSSTAKGTASWSSVGNLVDLSDKGRKSEKDTSKFKSILIEMKQAK